MREKIAKGGLSFFFCYAESAVTPLPKGLKNGALVVTFGRSWWKVIWLSVLNFAPLGMARLSHFGTPVQPLFQMGLTLHAPAHMCGLTSQSLILPNLFYSDLWVFLGSLLLTVTGHRRFTPSCSAWGGTL